jgi:hypothetical protein
MYTSFTTLGGLRSDTPLQKASTVYYDEAAHCFRTVRSRKENVVTVSGPASFYADAKTTKRTEQVPPSRVEDDFVEVEDPASFEYAEFSDTVDDWKIVDTGPKPGGHEDLLKRKLEDRPAVDVTGLEGKELLARAAERVGDRVVIEAQTDEDLRRFLDEYKALKQTEEVDR